MPTDSASARPELLVLAPLLPDAMARLNQRFLLHRLDLAESTGELMAEIAGTVRGIVTTGFRGCDAATMDRLPKLEIIGCMAVGVDAVDTAHAKARGIRVTNTPDVLNDCVADLAMGLLLSGLRRLPQADRYVRAGKWLDAPMPLATSLRGKRLGILGLGRIGLAIAQRAEPFGLSIAYHNRTRRGDVPYAYAASPVELARDSDILMAVTPGGAATRHIVDRAVMDALGPNGLLVNVARGSVVDEEALVAALAEGRLGGAALDVFADEPKVPPVLLEMEHVVLAPHVGSATHETRNAMANLVVDNLEAHFDGRPLPSAVV